MSRDTQDWRAALGALISPGERAEIDAADAAQEARKPEAPLRNGARLDISVERKGRGGKVATIVSGFTLADDDVERVASELKRTLGTGGSARGGEILIQGDRARAVADALTAMGFKNRII